MGELAYVRYAGMVFRARGFSLIELVLVVVIIGIVAAVAIPRMSRAVSASADSALAADLNTLRRAIDLYRAEHQGSPPPLATIVGDLTLYSDEVGLSVQFSRDAAHPFGPYIRTIPSLPVGAHQGFADIDAADGPTIGWIYDEIAGEIHANTTTETDDAGTLYSEY